MNFFNGCQGGFGGCNSCCDPCSLMLWLIILQNLCGCNNNGGCGMDACTLVILLLLCGGCNSCGNCGK